MEKNKIDEQQDELKVEANKTKAPAQNPEAKKTSATLIIALLALAVAAITAMSNHRFKEHVTKEHQQVTQMLKTLQQSQSTTNDVSNQVQNLVKQQESMNKATDKLKQDLNSALKQHFYQSEDWMLLKARYYLELSEINKQWSSNYDASIALLRDADSLLRSVNDQELTPVRQAIAEEITLLKASISLDTTGLLSQLDAMQQTLNKLPMPSALVEETTSPKSTDKSAPWYTQWRKSMELLEKIVVIRRHEGVIQPLMSPLLEASLKENVRLSLQGAQWAILNNNSQVYQLCLKQAVANLKQSFDPNAKAPLTLIKEIEQLQKVNFNVPKPPKGQALKLLDQLIEKNDQQGERAS